MATQRTLSPSLAALMSAAAALAPSAHAQTAPAAESDSRVSYRFNEYGEDEYSGASDRQLGTLQSILAAIPAGYASGSRGALDVTATHEVMSGSSPWYVLPGSDNRPIQVLSGATIQEHRSEVRAAYTLDPGTSASTTFNVSYSQERDYHATALGIEHSFPLSNALTLGLGGSFSHDLIAPTDAALYFRVQHEEKDTGSVFGSLAWVIDKSSVVQTGIQLNVENGYLSDPYKLVSIGDELAPPIRAPAAAPRRHGCCAIAAHSAAQTRRCIWTTAMRRIAGASPRTRWMWAGIRACRRAGS